MNKHILLYSMWLFIYSCTIGSKPVIGAHDKNAPFIDLDSSSGNHISVPNGELITEKYWKLINLQGKAVNMTKNQQREMWFLLRSNPHKINGFSGCNGLNGSYQLSGNGTIHLDPANLTKETCPDAHIRESEFLKVLEDASTFTVRQDTLWLKGARSNTSAIFVAVYFQ